MWWQLPHHVEKKMILYVKMNSKRIKDFELQNETLENIGKYCFNFVMWTAFLNMTKKLRNH